jgi:GAF domain-containing protein
MSFDSAELPPAFRAAVDRPVSGEIAVLPVPGSDRVIAIIYLDNGARDRPVGDIEIFELAAFQLGLALENEFLRRSGSAHGTDGPAIKMHTMG